jgi:hypothetical protein
VSHKPRSQQPIGVSGALTEVLIGEQPNGVGDLAGKSEVQLTEEFSWIQQIRLRVGIAARVCATDARLSLPRRSGRSLTVRRPS